MLIFLCIIFILIIYGISFKNINNINEEALSRISTTSINGIFVLIILLSHFNSYVIYSSQIDLIYYRIITMIGQLMVTSFLFYSGYGIYESIKTKKDYINNFFKNRILKLFIMFSLVIILYIIFNVIAGKHYGIMTILLSFIGYTSIGNSNWFIFATFYLYFATLLSFKLTNGIKSLILSFILSVLYIVIMRFIGQDSYWYDTILCFNIGMLFSLYKNKILLFLNSNKNYIITIFAFIIIFIITRKFQYIFVAYELMSMSFICIIVLLSLKIKVGNQILYWFGQNTFNIYALQRLIYMCVGYLNVKNVYAYFIISIILIIAMSIIFEKALNMLFKKIYK